MAAISLHFREKKTVFLNISRNVPEPLREEYKKRACQLYEYFKQNKFQIDKLCYKKHEIKVGDRVTMNFGRGNRFLVLGTVTKLEEIKSYSSTRPNVNGVRVLWDFYDSPELYRLDTIYALKPTPDD